MQNREEALLKLCSDNYALDKQNNMQKIKDFISGGVNIDCRDITGKTPLHLAVENTNTNSKELVIFLLNNGANYKAKDLMGKQPHETRTKGNGSWNKEAVIVLEFSDKREQEKEKSLVENSKSQLDLIGKMLKTIEEQNHSISDMKRQIIELNQKLQSQPPGQNASIVNSTSNQKFF